MTCLQLANLIICVGFQNINGSDLEGLVLEADLVVIEIPSSSMSSQLIICFHLMGSNPGNMM